jgi:GTP-binding protein EngB required for normal cell division
MKSERMDTQSTRSLVSQLADDLGWLEQHCRRQDEHGQAAVRLRLAAALVRNCLGPLLNDQPAAPLHIAVVGGAGAGKSTVANLLTGALGAAEANPQAGYTRHPVAYSSSNGPLSWVGHNGFLGPLRRLNQPGPANLDQDVYQVRRVPADPSSFDLLKDFVVWDCPDMTTWAATGYIPRLTEVAALADVVVYVASDERYNDEIPTQFLHMLLQAGKPVVVCLTKMRESDSQQLAAHFQKEVISHLPSGVVGVLAIPNLTPAQLAQPSGPLARYRIPLLNQVAVLGVNPGTARRRTAQGAATFLGRTHDQLLAVARQDLAALETWQGLVRSGQTEFDNRYLREYLTSEKYRGFDEALVRLMELLEMPGIGRVLSGALYYLRTPYRWVTGLLGQAMNRPEAASRPEHVVLDDALAGWLDLLRKESARRMETHPLWAHIATGFHDGTLGEATQERFQQGLRQYRTSLTAEADRTARAIYEDLEKKPVVLNTLRGSKFALDAGAIGVTVASLGTAHLALDFVMVPLVASVTHQLVELMGKGYVDTHREQTRQRQQLLEVQYLSGPLAEFLIQWPSTGGSSFERLQLALRRIPPALEMVDGMLRARMA